MKHKKLKSMKLLILLLSVIMLQTSCYQEEVVAEEEIAPGEGLKDWSFSTHSNDVSPDYSIVFPQDKVNRVDIVFDSEDWQDMLDDLTNNIGPFGSGGDFPPPPMFFGSEGNFPEPPGGNDFTPVFKEASVFFNDIEWYKVGIRFKGNSSLRSAWQSGIKKLSFRFDFDEFEDDNPEIKNQRFYGFQKLAFSNNFNDNSFLHEKLAADIFRDAGVKAAQTAYYRIYVDFGEGPVYFGLYTAVEIIEDSMLDSQFGSDAGNCYKPENAAATFAYGTFNAADFDLKTNEDAPDYSDVESLYEIINSSIRTSDEAQWKAQLESVFDVDNFMHWLAVNTAIQNWDTYGLMNHNYYLYNNPYTNKLVWIPWDNNEALTDSGREPLPLSMDIITSDWPLIRYIIDIPEYEQLYNNYLLDVVNNAFEASNIKQSYSYYHILIEEYVIGSEGEQEGYTFLKSSSDFTQSLNEIQNHAEERNAAVINYLSK